MPDTLPAYGQIDYAADPGLDHLWEQALSPHTRTVYNSGLRAFLMFMSMSGVTWYPQALPCINEQVLLNFVSHCHYKLKVTHSTTREYLSGVRFHILSHGVNNPWCNNTLLRLQTIMRSLKKLAGVRAAPRLPVTIVILKHIVRTLNGGLFSAYLDIMLAAAFCTAFFGFLRCGELTYHHFNPSQNLSMEDVVFASENSKFHLKLKASKLTYSEDPLFVMSDGTAFTRTVFVSSLKSVLTAAGWNDRQFNGHSFRIGAATSAAAANVPDHLIKTLGRWSSDSYLRYIRTSDSAIGKAHYAMCGLPSV
ncbi:LOW QUALITY PROTEIN: uncharacterized protein LOC124266160 [Haliotis rubra]|uniref:LOW QUALITY PROTEIN: uncharacterized protein LOC124266160 n=1 Tax=Haliotis rubra TaxID=36100 RepID=UPI001EE4EC07|nr:LOW QUALITY PROTEIN: uncharacterized protein LOC124266160 [Haliotis rubra]